ncbi:uncharacterized protein DS421_10g300420 [Arachis hypogaea]|nr:uncharacterized protein DS421_10g300420 [Arachis hypogaea]
MSTKLFSILSINYRDGILFSFSFDRVVSTAVGTGVGNWHWHPIVSFNVERASPLFLFFCLWSSPPSSSPSSTRRHRCGLPVLLLSIHLCSCFLPMAHSLTGDCSAGLGSSSGAAEVDISGYPSVLFIII